MSQFPSEQPTLLTSVDPERVTNDSDQRPGTPPADFSVAREESTEEPGNDSADVNILQPSPELTSSPEPGPVPENRGDTELLTKYREARAEIERLQSLLASVPSSPTSELRRRNRALSDDGSTMGETDVGTMIEEHQLHQEGVPLQVVVIIALGVFITTYLFF